MWHDGHVCTASCIDGTQKGIRQQPRIPPKKQISNAISHVAPPGSYRTTVIICCRHEGHCMAWGAWLKNPPNGWITVTGWAYVITGGGGGATINTKKFSILIFYV